MNDTEVAILEVGAGDAEFSRCFLRKNKKRLRRVRADVVEPSPAFDALYRKLGIVKIAKTVEELLNRRGSYDIICFSHCLEHFIDPSLAVAGCGRLLKRNGVMLAEVPNCDDTYWQYRFFPDPPHLHFFNYTSLKQMFECSGMKVELLRSYGYKNRVEAQIGYLEKTTPPFIDNTEAGRLEQQRLRKSRSFIALHGGHSPYHEDYIDYFKTPTSSGRNYLFIGGVKA